MYFNEILEPLFTVRTTAHVRLYCKKVSSFLSFIDSHLKSYPDPEIYFDTSISNTMVKRFSYLVFPDMFGGIQESQVPELFTYILWKLYRKKPCYVRKHIQKSKYTYLPWVS